MSTHHVIAILALCALLASACSPPPPPPAAPQDKPTGTKAPEEPKSNKIPPEAPKKDPKAQGPTPKAPQETRSDLDFNEDSALAMAKGLKEAAADDKNLQGWLEKYAVYPFDVDGAHKAADLKALEEVLAKERPDLQGSLQPHETCEARTRAQLLEGAPFHYVDRLGDKPPKEELERDLTRMGLEGEDILVNCYHKQAAGFFLIVGDLGGKAVLKALRM